MAKQTAADVMTPAPDTVDVTETLQAAARSMAEHDVGVLVVRAGPTAMGVVTDRDLVVRGLAAGLDADATVQQVVTDQVITVGITDPVETVVEVMRAGAVRRVPVLDGNVLAGIISIGDLAIERDADSALADISRTRPSR